MQASLSPPRRAAKATRVTALSLRIAAFADRRPKLLALLLGALSATGFAPLHLWPLTLMALAGRSEEHTSELQSLMRISYAVICLKKKKKLRRELCTLKITSLTHTCTIYVISSNLTN